MEIVAALLHYYRFDRGTASLADLLGAWEVYDPNWVRLAIVEAIYRGRYKAVSVSEILRFWERRGEPYFRFSHEFERSICGDFVFSLPTLSLPLEKSPPQIVQKEAPPPPLPNFEGSYSQVSPFENRLRALCITSM